MNAWDFRSTLRGAARTKLYFETDQSQKPELCHRLGRIRDSTFEEEIAEIWNYAEIFAKRLHEVPVCCHSFRL